MEPIGNGSEGDAYRYTKKVLKSLPNAARLYSIYSEVAAARGISSWTRAAYQDLRAHFFRDGQCKIRFAPGAARIAFGELDLGTGDEEPEPIGRLHDIIRIVSIAHADEYDRYMGKDGHRPSFKEFDEMYGKRIAAHWSAMRRQLRKRKYGPRRYKIIPLDDFETANQYYDYTKPFGWCHLGSKGTFDHYHMSNVDGHSLPVRLYLAVLPGFETMTVNDDMYGESMLGIDIGPGGRLVHVNNRWNHAHDALDERKGDNKYDETELSDLLGGPFFELCPPYCKDSYLKFAQNTRADRLEQNAKIKEMRKRVYRSISLGRNRARKSGTFTDPRDGQVYRTETLGGRTWLAEPMRYSVGDVRRVPENITELLDVGEPDIRVYIPTLVERGDGSGQKEYVVNWTAPFEGDIGDEYFSERCIRLDAAAEVRNARDGIYTVHTKSRVYVNMDGNIDAYEPVYNVFIDAVKIGNTLVEGHILDDLSDFFDIGPDGDDAGYAERLNAERTKAIDTRRMTVMEAMREAGMQYDRDTVAYVTDMLSEEYKTGKGISEFRMMSQAEWNGPASAIVLNHYPTTRNYVRGGRARELVTYRYLPDPLSAEVDNAIRALSPDATVSVLGHDGVEGILYKEADVEKAIPPGWRLPDEEDLYRMYAALGATVVKHNPSAGRRMSYNDYITGKSGRICGIRIPKALKTSDAYPSMEIETDLGRNDAISRGSDMDEEIVETGMSAMEIMCSMLGFSSLAQMTMTEFGGTNGLLLGKIAPLVINELHQVKCVGPDGEAIACVHILLKSKVSLEGDKLVLGMNVEKFTEDTVADLAAVHGEDAINALIASIRKPKTMYGRRFLFLVKD